MKPKIQYSHVILDSREAPGELTRPARSHGFFIGRALLLLLAFTFLVSCDFSDPVDNSHPDQGIKAKCRHTAILQYLVFNELYEEVEIVWGASPPGSPTPYHAQARAKIDGKWYWLKTAPIYVFIGEQDNFEPFYYNVPIEEALKWSGVYVCE